MEKYPSLEKTYHLNLEKQNQIIDDIIVEGPEPEHDEGYFIITEEPKQHLSNLEKGIPLLDFYPKFR
jgi:hypothetical protein